MPISSLKEKIKIQEAFKALQRSTADTRYNDQTTAASAVGIDTKNFDQAIIALALGTITSPGTLDVTVLESSVGTTAAGANAITNAVIAQKSNGDSGLYVGQIDTKNTKRYLYVKAVAATASAKAYGISVILGKSDGLDPVTQVNTVAFTA